MPKLTKATEALRVTQAVQALSLIANGMSKSEACEKAGLTIGQYYRWVGRGEETIKAIRDTALELQRRQMVDILTAQEEATHKLIDEMLSDETDPQVRLKLFMYLDQKLEKLAIEHHAAGHAEDRPAPLPVHSVCCASSSPATVAVPFASPPRRA